MAQPPTISRRRLIAAGGAALVTGLAMPAIVRASARPAFTHGMQSGDVDASSGMIWTRVDRPARVLVEYDTTGRFTDPSRLAPIDALPESDLTVKRLLDGLPPDQDIFFRFVAEDLSSPIARSEPIVGRFRTAPSSHRDIRFAWSGDTAGQGFGIDAEG
jgi:alkaline phosphatase D